MFRFFRLLIKNTSILRKTIYVPSYWFVNHVVRYRSILLQRHGATILSKVNDLSRQHSVDVYPTFGTLLGLIRDGRLMKHDFDMDFAILPSATNLSVFFAELQKEGFYFEWMETVDD